MLCKTVHVCAVACTVLEIESLTLFAIGNQCFQDIQNSKVSCATFLSFIVDEIKMESTGCSLLLAADNNSRSLPRMSSISEKAGGKLK